MGEKPVQVGRAANSATVKQAEHCRKINGLVLRGFVSSSPTHQGCNSTVCFLSPMRNGIGRNPIFLPAMDASGNEPSTNACNRRYVRAFITGIQQNCYLTTEERGNNSRALPVVSSNETM
jgi:hypothetical protein